MCNEQGGTKKPMEMQENKAYSRSDFLSWGMLALLFVYMLSLNFLMPLHRDDYWYSLIWGTMDKLAVWPDVFQSMYAHYLTHGGRMTAYVVLSSFLLAGKFWFNLFNSFMYVALIVLMYWHSQRQITWRFQPHVLLLLITFTWLGLPHFAEVTIWMAGSCTYLFTAVLILAFFLPYHFQALGRGLWQGGFWASLSMLILGVLAGWGIENTSATTAFVSVCATFYFYKKKQLQTWMLTGCFGAVLGMVMLVAAPGNYVRFDDSKTKLLYHFTNLIAAGAEALLYVLPVVLFLLLAWRVLRACHEKGAAAATENRKLDGTFIFSSVMTMAAIAFLLLSYSNGHFFSTWLGPLLIAKVAVPLGVATPRLQVQLFNTLSGLEEMLIYLLTITQLYRYAFTKLSLRKKDLRGARSGWGEIMAVHPACWHVAAWLALALFNHFVMVASPRFPARATFGSVTFLLIATAGVFTVPEVRQYFLETARRKYMALFAVLVLLPMMAATLNQYVTIHREDGARMAYVREMAAQGATELEVAPISIKNRVLRHVYFEDLNNSVSRDLLCNYYGLKTIKLKE